MKKILSVFLSVLLLFTMMPVSIMGVAAENAPAISLDAPAQGVERGATFTVDVVMSGNPGIICWRTCVAYDSAVLELVDQTAGDAFGITYMSFGPLRSPASAMWCDAIGDNVAANGVMYTLTFRVPADAAAGTYPLTLSVLYPEDDILNSDMEAVYFDLVSTTVTVVDHYHAYDNACDYDCNICGDVREVEPHNYVGRIEIAPTCVDEGVMRHTCTVCGDNFTVAIPAVGHDYSAVVTAPTCESAGYTTHTCANCGDSYVDAEVAALGHAYKSVVTIAPTCTEDGVKTYTCQNCDSSYIEAIPANGEHTYGHACSESCSVCGVANDGAAAHTYSHVYDVDCDVCGAVREVTILMGDLNGDGKVNIRDLGLLQQYLNGWEVTILADVADLNADGKINIRDLGLFQQYLNGWDVNLGG